MLRVLNLYLGDPGDSEIFDYFHIDDVPVPRTLIMELTACLSVPVKR